MNPRAVNRLLDALDSARTVQHFVEDYALSTYTDSRLVRSAVERELGIIGATLGYAPRDESGVVALPLSRVRVVHGPPV